MFGKCLKNYFISLKYIFAVIGIMFIALMIGGTVFTKGASESFTKMTEQIKEATGNEKVNATTIANDLKIKLGSEMESDSITNRGTIDDDGDMMVSGGELQNAIVDAVTSSVSAQVDNFVDYVSELGKIISATIIQILLLLMIFVGIQILGTILAKGFVILCAGSEIEHRNMFHLIVARFLNTLFAAVTLVFLAWVLMSYPMVGVVCVIVYPAVYCIFSLLFSALAQGRKHRAPLSKILGIGNILTLLTSNILVLIICIAIGYGVLVISSGFVAFYVVLSLCIVTAAAVSINADMLTMAESHKKIETADVVEDDITYTEIN